MFSDFQYKDKFIMNAIKIVLLNARWFVIMLGITMQYMSKYWDAGSKRGCCIKLEYSENFV